MLKQLPGAGNTAEQVGIRAPRGVDFAVSHPLALEALVTALDRRQAGLLLREVGAWIRTVACGNQRRLLIEAFAAV